MPRLKSESFNECWNSNNTLFSLEIIYPINVSTLQFPKKFCLPVDSINNEAKIIHIL